MNLHAVDQLLVLLRSPHILLDLVGALLGTLLLYHRGAIKARRVLVTLRSNCILRLRVGHLQIFSWIKCANWLDLFEVSLLLLQALGDTSFAIHYTTGTLDKLLLVKVGVLRLGAADAAHNTFNCR